MKCPNCGEMIKDKKKMNFCGFCGANLRTGEITFTSPAVSEDTAPQSSPVENLNTFTPNEPPVMPVPVNANYASPFEKMVKEQAAAQGFGGFQPTTTVTPPSFENVPQTPEVPVFTAPEPPVQNIVPPQAPVLTPPPVPSFAPSAPEISTEPVSAAPAAPVTPVAPAPSAPAPAPSPIASFNPASLSAFDPYAHTQPDASFGNIAVPAPQAPEKGEENPVVSAEPTPADRDASEAHDDIDKQLNELKNKRSSFEPSINLSKNVKIRNASDDPDASPITYMEYTKSSDNAAAETSESKYSSFSFSTPDAPAAPEVSDTPAVSEPVSDEVKDEAARKEEARKTIDESVDQILSFTTYQSSKNSISLAKETDKPDEISTENTAAETPAEPAPVITPEPEPVKEPEPEPEPEPVKEKVINYVGQEKKAAEQMIAFKGLVSEIEYVEDERDFNFVIAQSIAPDTEVLPGTSIKLTVSAGTWSEWEENPMPVSASNYITETKTEYRRRSRTRTTDKRDTTDTSEYEDYTLTGTDCRYSDWETDQYFSSEAIPPGDTCEIIRMANGFKYAGWFNPANMNGMSFSSPDVANFFNSNLSNVKWSYEEIISPENVKPDVKNWKLVTDNMTTTPAGDPMLSNIFFSAHVVDGKSYAMKFGSAETEWYVYKRRTLIETVYHFEKEIISDWSEWTEWSETEHTASEDCQVEKRTLTRSKRKIPNI